MTGHPDIDARLEAIPQLTAAGVRGWRVLAQGWSNLSLRVETDRGRWVVRLNREVPGVDREVEARVLAAAAPAGLAPPVIACDPRAGYLITEYLDAPAWRRRDLDRPGRLDRLARRVRRLHQLEVEVPPLDVPATIDGYLARAGAVAPELRAAAARLLAELEAAGYFDCRTVLCHHDLNVGNIIGEAPIRFVDWEFARRGHPALDLGFVIQYHDLPADSAAALAAAYYGSAARDAPEQVALAVRLAQLLELSWLSARAAQGDLDPGARERLKRLAQARS